MKNNTILQHAKETDADENADEKVGFGEQLHDNIAEQNTNMTRDLVPEQDDTEGASLLEAMELAEANSVNRPGLD